jgi:phosphoserine aminotransferase
MLVGRIFRRYRVINFNAGQSQIPLPVLEQAAKEMTDWHGSGMGVMEMMHRHPRYESILNTAIQDLRDLLHIPENYYVLFLQGGARLFFDAVPLNLAQKHHSASYLATGFWSKLAYEYARKYTIPALVGSSEAQSYAKVPDVDTWYIPKDPHQPAYFHFCANETINGVELNLTPAMLEKIGETPIVADMSSNFLSQAVDVSKYGVIYAGAQKNVGPAGVTIAILRKDLVGKAMSVTPCVMDWKLAAEQNSMYNTPPCYGIYMVGLYLQYIKANGGVPAFYQRSLEKSKLIYDVIDNSGGFYTGRIDRSCRSRMNIPLSIGSGDKALEKAFLAEAEANGMVHLAGHYTAGGIRASLYNGITVSETQKLAEFMKAFQSRNRN